MVMVSFDEAALKIISDYKLLLRKIYTANEAAAKIKTLGLKRTQLRDVNDVGLYKVVMKIIDDVEKYVKSYATAKKGCYCGAEKFLRHLKSFITQYRVDKDKVIHATRAASCAVVEAIQIITLPESRLNREFFSRLNKCVERVAKYGGVEHVNVLNNALKRSKKSLMKNLNKYDKALKFDDLLLTEPSNDPVE